jgi:hypothetical protein
MSAMKAVVIATTFILCVFLLAGPGGAETEPAPAPASQTQTPSLPGIIVMPPRLPADMMQPQSCPDTGRKLELIS